MDVNPAHIHRNRNTDDVRENNTFALKNTERATPNESIQQFYPSHDSHSQSVHVQTFCEEQGFHTRGVFFSFKKKT